jgi:hypothetical protein
MKQILGAVLGAALLLGVSGTARAAEDKDAMAVIDKGIKALGGEEKLKKVQAVTWKAKGKMTFFNTEADVKFTVTAQGLDHICQEFEAEAMGNKIPGALVLAGDKGWRKFGDNVMEMDKNNIAGQKRAIYMQAIPITLVQLKGKDFKVEAAGEEKVGDKPAAKLKVTGPDGKDFLLYLDKDSGLPVKLSSKMNFMGEEATIETTFGNYKEFDGIKKATKIEAKRNGEAFQTLEITEFKVLDKVDPKTFEKPK